MTRHDLLVRGGTVIDGTGADAFEADVAVDDGTIVAVGDLADHDADEVIDADGLLVTPGFVDIHTHYDGQATWDPVLAPSSLHGVTTIVCGNCGVGFAPARGDRREWLVGLMEGVEDIPGAALSEGIQWEWESFPEYLDALDRRSYTVDIGTQVAHGAVRAYVMGDRGAANEPAGDDDIDQMAAIVQEAVEAGALGFSTSRTLLHKAVDGEPVPGTFAAEDELFGIGRALGEVGAGVFEVAPAGAAGEDVLAPHKEIDWMCRLSAEIDRPVTFALLQHDAAPDDWRKLMDLSMQACDDGAHVYPQVAGRPFGMLVGHQTTYHPFLTSPTYEALDALPFDEKVARLRDPGTREQVIAEATPTDSPLTGYERMFVMGDELDYEPPPEKSVASIAEREGRGPVEVAYDLMLEQDGRALLLVPLLNYAYGDAEPIREMLLHPQGALGLGDGGAHCGIICDASIPTFLLTHWGRDRQRGERLPLELLVRKQTRDTARLYGLDDRGTVEPGMKADLVVLDFDRLALAPPEVVFDLPAGGRRLVQGADGYVATICSGEVTFRDGEATGARPGRLIRGAQQAAGAG